jgi:hypothetical protein
VQLLGEQPTTVDFSHYRSVLKNQAVIDEIEKRFKEFKPATYDVSRQLKAIEAFEVEAVKNAEATKEKVDLELKDLEATLKNIETARPFEDLTVVRTIPYLASHTSRLVVYHNPGLKLTTNFCRTRWPLLNLPSTRRLPSSCPRAAGESRGTRYASLQLIAAYHLLTSPTGALWRSLSTISSTANNYSLCPCTLAL